MTPPSIEKLVTALEKHNVQYTIIGGYALLLWGGVNTTQDIDLCVSLEQENLDNLAAALTDLVPRNRNGTQIAVDKYAFTSRFSTFFTDAGIVQIISSPQGFSSFESLAAESASVELRGIPIRIATLSALRKMKEQTGRAKDADHLATIDALEQLQADQD